MTILSQDQMRQSIADAFSRAVEHAYKDLLDAAVRAEREACAKVCDVLSTHPEYASEVTKLAAQAIRARNNP